MPSRSIKDHHRLTRNLNLNGHWLSNDGDDEGIKINAEGALATDLHISNQGLISGDATALDLRTGVNSIPIKMQRYDSLLGTGYHEILRIHTDNAVGIGMNTWRSDTAPNATLEVHGTLFKALSDSTSVSSDILTGTNRLITSTAHGLNVGDAVRLKNTGATTFSIFEVARLASVDQFEVDSDVDAAEDKGQAYYDTNLFQVVNGADTPRLTIDKTGEVEISQGLNVTNNIIASEFIGNAGVWTKKFANHSSIYLDSTTDQYLNCDDVDGFGDTIGDNYTGDLSMSLWFKAGVVNVAQGLITLFTDFDGTDNGEFYISLNNDDLQYWINNASWKKVVDDQVVAGTWYHVVATFQNIANAADEAAAMTASKLYLNGVEVNAGTGVESGDGFPPSGAIDGNNLKTIVGGYYSSSYTFTGNIDEVAVWNYLLTDADVTSIYNSGKPNDLAVAGSYSADRTSNLKAYYRMESSKAGIITDESSLANHATIVNGATFSSDVPNCDSYYATGNIGIGTTAPDELLEVQSVGSDTKMRISAFTTTNTECGTIQFVKGEDAVADQWTNKTDSGDAIGRLDFIATPADDNTYNASAQILVKQINPAGTYYVPTQILFLTSNDGTGAPTQKMCIRNDGHVGIGDTSPDYRLAVENTSTQLKVAYNDTSYITVGVDTSSHTTFATAESGNIILDSAGAIELNADSGTIDFNDASVNLATLTAGSLAFDNAANATLVVDATAAGTAGRDLTIEAGSAATAASNNTDGGDLILKAGGGDGTGTSIMTFSTKMGTGASLDTSNERMRIHTNGFVGIGVADPDAVLEILYPTIQPQLKISYDASNYCETNVAADGGLEINSYGTDPDITLIAGSAGAEGDINFRAMHGDVFMYETNNYTNAMHFDVGSTPFFKMRRDINNYARFALGDDGALEITTVDSDGSAGHLTLDTDGDVVISGADVKMDATNKLYLDGGGDTYIHERASDNIEIIVGGDTMMVFQEHGDDGNALSFAANTSVSFVRQAITYDATNTIVDFRLGNKAFLSVTGAITNLKLYFPEQSGNFVLYLFYTGDYTITNYLAYAFDESAATVDNVMWPSGTKPDNTASGRDIFSFYWDSTLETAFGVASLAFAEP